MIKNIKNNKAFTLLEMLIVVAIIGLLIAIAVPTFQGIMARGRDTAIKADMRSIRIVADMMRTEGKDFSTVHCNPGGAPEIRAICDKVRGNSPHPDQIRSFATVRSFCIQAPLHSRKFWRVDSAGFSGYDLCGYVGRWDMNEGSGTIVHDRSGNANHGTMHNFASPHGWVGGAISFDGANDYVRVPHHANLNLNTYTISIWVRRAAGGGYWQNLIEKGAHPENYAIWINRDGAFAHHCLFVGVTRACLNSPGGMVPLDTWVHVVGTFDGTHIRNYINGVFVGTPLHFPGNAAHNIHHGLTMGGRGWWPFSGSMSNVHIYNRVLTAEEVYASFRRGR